MLNRSAGDTMNFRLAFPIPRSAEKLFAAYLAFVIIVSLVFGGGTQQAIWSDAVAQLTALPLLGIALFRLQRSPWSLRLRLALIVVLCTLALPLLQLVSLPPAIWTALPGRVPMLAAFQAVGLPIPWEPLTLDPAATWRGFLAMLPACAVFLATLTLESSARSLIARVILSIVGISIVLDILQIVGDVESPFRFYSFNSYHAGIGFFANANHNATLLFCAIPLVVGAFGAQLKIPEFRTGTLVIILSVVVAAIIGLATTWSRAGLLLALIGGLPTFVLASGLLGLKSTKRLFQAGATIYVAALLVAFQFGFVSLSEKFDRGIMSDLRWPVAKISWQAVRETFPVGAGVGSFVPVYEMHAPRELVLKDSYVNHAHDDWLELLLVGGLPIMLILALFLAWLGISTVAAWRGESPGFRTADAALAKAASIAVALVLMHSAVDYPLRTIAIETLFAFCCACMLPARLSDHIPVGARSQSDGSPGSGRPVIS